MLHQTHRQDMESAKYFPDQRSIQYMLTTNKIQWGGGIMGHLLFTPVMTQKI